MKVAPGKNDTIRAFVSIGLGENVRSNLATAASRLKDTGAKVSWVPAANLHLSMAFLGDIRADTAGVLGETMDNVTSSHGQFSLEVVGVGTFGRPKSPRVIWAGIADSPSLAGLQAELQSELISLGIELETRPFHPHVTLGRVRSSRACGDLLYRIGRLGQAEFGKIRVASVELMRSVLNQTGARYTMVHKSKLGATRQR
ncbi:MAG: RNA 2',3'-cyclic phosphodiesterase [Kiritimatiellia bacterium]|nr:RNA 2',3'-cyclic phosphodiesterase [Kiritimatiellia bacterium]MDP6847447.1 RNA 2',3'-cyclic phosphodiesterase [Kiritimatiellia bacterium]